MKRFLQKFPRKPLVQFGRALTTLLLTLITALLPQYGMAFDQSIDVDRKTLVDGWDQRFARIESARADFSQLFLLHVELVPYGRDKLLQLIERHRDFSEESNQIALANALCSDRLSENQRCWHSQHALSRGNEYYLSGRERYRSMMSTFDVSRSLSQVDVYDRGTSNVYLYTIGELRKVTTREFVQLAQCERTTDNQCKLKYRSEEGKRVYEAVIDTATGFMQSRLESDFDGNAIDETLQWEPMTFADGIVYPRMQLHCKYQNGSVTWFDATLLENATFNQPITDEEFSVPVQVGATVVDLRGGVHKTYTATEEFSDALVALSTLESARMARLLPADQIDKLEQLSKKLEQKRSLEKPKRGSWGLIVINVCGISLILLLMLWRLKSGNN